MLADGSQVAILTAIIGAAASLIIAILGIVAGTRSQRQASKTACELEELKDDLASRRADVDAKRDYEYEARKRLYAQCEPLVFEALELARNARFRVISLARSARLGEIRPNGSGWLSRPGYYFQSTSFMLLAPITSSKILQRSLTHVDLRLEPRLRMQYELLKLIFLSFTDHFALAEGPPRLDYDPDRADPGQPKREELLANEPQIYARQGFYLGSLEVIAEQLITYSGGVARCKSFGEFLLELGEKDSQVHALVPEFTAMFGGFHPWRKPVLWRILVSQLLLYDAFLQTEQWSDGKQPGLDGLLDLDGVAELDWRTNPSESSDQAIREVFEVGRNYAAGKFAAIEQRLNRGA